MLTIVVLFLRQLRESSAKQSQSSLRTREDEELPAPQPKQSWKKKKNDPQPMLSLCNKQRYNRIVSPAGTRAPARAALTFPGCRPASALDLGGLTPRALGVHRPRLRRLGRANALMKGSAKQIGTCQKSGSRRQHSWERHGPEPRFNATAQRRR